MLKVKQYLLSTVSVLILFTASLQPQTFNTSVNSTTIGQNEPFQISFQFNGEGINSIKNFKAPDFKGLRILSGPNQSTSMQIINGAVSGSVTYSYYVQSSNLGALIIGAASLDYKGKTFHSQPVKLTVIKGQAPQNNNQSEKQQRQQSAIGDNIFLKVEADRQKVYKGEQVTVTYKLYTRMSIASPQVSKLPSYQGFWSEELETSNKINFTLEVVNGRQYNVGILKKAALFPTQTGQLTVSPIELKIPVVVPKQRRRGDVFDEFFDDPFFNEGQTVEYNAKSNTLKIDVMPLPQNNVHPGFNGAVGDFTFKASVDKNTVKANDAVTLKLTVSGVGNIGLLEMPDIKLPAGFEKYDPKINTQLSKSGALSGQKTVEYLIVPRVQGEKEIPPVEFSYFNPKLNKYVAITSGPFKLNIEKGEDGFEQNSTAGYNKEDVKLLSEDIRFIKTETDDISKEESYTISSSGFWLAAALPLLALSSAVIWKKRKDKIAGDARLMKYYRAEKMARGRLKVAQKSLQANRQKEFFSDISLALFGYLEDKLHIDKSEFTIARALDVLRANNVEPELVENVRQLVGQCEFARFAPIFDSSSKMNEMYEQSVRIIVEMEKHLTMINAA